MLKSLLLNSRKAQALVLVGVIFVCVGLANYTTYHELTPQSRVAYRGQFELFADLRVWGTFFIISGAAAIVAAYCNRLLVGFFALMLMSSWWGALFVVGLALTGYTRIIPSILTWLLISGFLYTLSSWPEFPTHMLEEDHEV